MPILLRRLLAQVLRACACGFTYVTLTPTYADTFTHDPDSSRVPHRMARHNWVQTIKSLFFILEKGRVSGLRVLHHRPDIVMG